MKVTPIKADTLGPQSAGLRAANVALKAFLASMETAKRPPK